MVRSENSREFCHRDIDFWRVGLAHPAVNCSFSVGAAALGANGAGGLLFGGDRRVFGSGTADRRARGEGVVVERASRPEEAGGLRGPGGPLLGRLAVLTATQPP